MPTLISIITTGGTIDGADSDKKLTRETSSAVKWLQNQTDIQYTHIPLMNKDSRLITDLDRTEIVRTVMEIENNLILITHGTFTICETGRAIKKTIGGIPKTIFLVGAWIPFCEPNSDAENQMSYALKMLTYPMSGVFIAMDNHLWDPDFTDKKETTIGQYQLQTITKS